MQINILTFDRVIEPRTKLAHLRLITKTLNDSLVNDGLRLWRESHDRKSSQFGGA
jgi:hypothetical protein